MKKLLTLFLIIFLLSACSNNKGCLIKEVRTVGISTIQHYEYDQNNNISIIKIIDSISGVTKINKYKRDLGKIVRVGENDSSLLFIDNKKRIISYSYNAIPDNVYQMNYKYNEQGYLAQIEERRFVNHGAELFTTNRSDVTYLDNNPVKVNLKSVLEPQFRSNGSSYETEYQIIYYEPGEVKFTNNSIFTYLVKFYPEFSFVAYKESGGILPNKLIKSIVIKTQGELDTRQFFTYKADKDGNIVTVDISFNDGYNKPAYDSILISYYCLK